MTLFYDMQTHRPSLYIPPECTGRERQTVTIARLIAMIAEEKKDPTPKWKRYYLRNREKILARVRVYREVNRDRIREYNRNYKRARQRRRIRRPGQAVLLVEVMPCSG
ncbi:MAG: hypothetical protein QMC82_07560 [Methanolinea sp.]|nr:hypothetical protein [Methanolinea sp.]